jgi:uncharacterized membrane protein
MVVPFEGFVVPSPAHLAVLAAGTLAVAAALSFRRPPVSDAVVLAFAPWMVTGAAFHVLYQVGRQPGVGVYPPSLEPFFSAPAVYLTTFVLMGAVWVVATVVADGNGSNPSSSNTVPRYLGGVGVVIVLVLFGLVVRQGQAASATLRPVFPAVGLLVSLVLTGLLSVAIDRWRPAVLAETGDAGVLVLFAHVFDGVTTTIGVDVLGTGERSALPARIMDLAGALPTAQYVGTGWLFVVVKIAVATAVLAFFVDFVREEPARAYLLLAVVAAVGLGPGANNFLLFLLGGG